MYILSSTDGRFCSIISLQGGCQVGLGCKNTLTSSLQRGKTPANEYPGYDTKQSAGEVPVMLGLRGIRSTPSWALLPGPLWPGVVVPDWGLSMG